MAHELRRSVYLAEPNIANFSFSYDAVRKRSRGVSPDGKVQVETPLGAVLSMQINLIARTAAAFANATNIDRGFIVGKTVKGCAATGKADFVN